MNRKAALSASAILGVALLAACSDSPTAPSSRSAFVPKSSFAVGDLTDATPVATQLKICKVGDAGGTFVTTYTAAIQPGSQGGTGGTGSPSVTTPLTVGFGDCRIAAIDNGDANEEIGDFFHVSENAPAVVGTTQELVSCVETAGAIPCNDSYFVNTAHGVTLTYRNTLPPPPPPPSGCTYTKGWYQSKNATLTGVDGLSISVENAFFQATPNKTGSVSFVGPNNLLNLYQQYLAALENGGAGSGITSVTDALTAVGNGTTVSAGGQLTTTLTNAQISANIAALTAFNEGTLAGWPHC